MKEEEFKKYVEKTDNNIKKILKDEELYFYQRLVKTFNQACDEKNNLEQALDEIEKYVIENSQYWDETGLRYWKDEKDEPHDILEIIKKAKENKYEWI